ncbi:hypothetical protein MQV74_01040 [Streptomyces sp. AN091965]|nr:hypothetical protein [Streptomyces sp. AN091965]MCI3927879.1 hypothetical protein [Streptomyces sp. AN091965]
MSGVDRRQAMTDPSGTVAEMSTAAMRELSRRAFPEPDAVADDASAPIEQVRLERRRQAACSTWTFQPPWQWPGATWAAAHCQYAAQPTPDRPDGAIIATTAADRWIGEPVRALELTP